MIVTAPHLSPANIAERYGVSVDKVLGWIGRGELRAVNVATSSCGRPRWKIAPEALDAFEAARGNTAPTEAPRRKKRSTVNVVEFYR